MKVLVVASVLVATASAATINQRAIDPGCNAKYPFQYWPNIELCCDYFGLSSCCNRDTNTTSRPFCGDIKL
ncbi:hypothetical protein BGZ60DRAFT_532641 [Tricladium varicosporioides]|nr:hypothetical protein BGZ60DRAFT_532641 [Hymenoscyphus varicosporioides]